MLKCAHLNMEQQICTYHKYKFSRLFAFVFFSAKLLPAKCHTFDMLGWRSLIL